MCRLNKGKDNITDALVNATKTLTVVVTLVFIFLLLEGN